MVSQTVEYALHAMTYLASMGGAAVNSRRIAGQTRIPHGYLSKVMRDLVVAELISSFRGPGGGFTLARDPSSITILDIVNAVEPMERTKEFLTGDPLHSSLSALRGRIKGALESIEDSLRSTTLAELLEPVPPLCRPKARRPSLPDEHRARQIGLAPQQPDAR